MSRLQIGIVRYLSVAKTIGNALGIDPPPYVRIGHGRITITFRSLGASRWPENQQVELALRAAETARAVLAKGSQRAVRRRTARAIVVVYEDSSVVRGCVVVARWECVVPVPASHDD
jgi:hypothetical protein